MSEKKSETTKKGGSCCCGICSRVWPYLTARNIISFFVILYAYVIYDVARLTPAFSEQWFLEIVWWTKWMFLRGIQIDPIPLKFLKHHHSQLTLHELFVANDSQAIEKFVAMAEDPMHKDKIIVLRNVFANITDSPLQKFTTIDYFREKCDMSRVYNAFNFPKDEPGKRIFQNLSDVLDVIESSDENQAGALIFDTDLVDNDEFMHTSYRNLLKQLSPELDHRMWERRMNTHTFLYWGKQMYTALHAAFVSDYFLQISNAKEWNFVHKHYLPYIGLLRSELGTAFSPFYGAEGYANPPPFLKVTVEPGDLMFFSQWQLHEVANKYPDQLGFSIGSRPQPRGPMFSHPAHFRPLRVYNTMSFPMLMKYLLQLKLSAIFGKDAILGERQECIGKYGLNWDYAYNGTCLAKYQYRWHNGVCEFAEKDKRFQQKEYSKEWSVDDWHPHVKDS